MIEDSMESTYSELLSVPRPAEIHQLPGQVRHAFGAEGCLIVLRVVPVAVARRNRQQTVLLTRASSSARRFSPFVRPGTDVAVRTNTSVSPNTCRHSAI